MPSNKESDLSTLGYMLGGWEIALLAGLGLLLFGTRLPGVGRSLGSAIVQFRKAVKGSEDESDTSDSDNPPDGRGGKSE